MRGFEHDGFHFSTFSHGEGDPVLLIHGFASSKEVNWVQPGWAKTLTDAGYRVLAFDNRGHGGTTRSRVPDDYMPEKMASDALAFLDSEDIARAHVMGYSMGARIAAFLALAAPDRVASLVLGGLGSGMTDGVGDWDPIAEALLADDPATITHARGAMFRAFADKTKSDRFALAACISASRTLLSPDQIRQICMPCLVAVGSKDDIAGDPHALAKLLPRGEALDIPGRDHMLAVGDKVFKAAVLAFFEEHPL